MTNPYFDIKAPQNNKIWDYNFKGVGAQTFSKKLKPQDLYKIIRFAFVENKNNDPHFVLIKDFIKECLQDPSTHKYLSVRTKYLDTPPDTPRRNNIIHDITTSHQPVFYVGDIELMKEIITCAVEAGVNPLERSVYMDMSPVGIFMRGHMIQNQVLVEVKQDFFQFLINLNPKSLIDFGPDNQCALETIARSDLSLWQQELPRIQVVMENLPLEGIDKNLVWLEAAHKKNKNKSTQTVKEAIDRLRINKEALFLNASLNGAFADRKEKIHKI